MDVIQLSGYTEEEKLGIARKYLVPKQLEAHGLSPERLTISPGALRAVIREYTREAGVRNLERRIADLCRKTARAIAEGKTEKVRIDARKARSWLGPRRVPSDPRKRTADPGVATGLAYTPVGGDVLFIEATAYPGKGKLTITGQLGDVMQRVGADRALLGAGALRVARAAGRLVRRARRAHPRAGRSGAEGRPVRRDHDGDRDRLARARRAGRRRPRDDRRDHAHRAGAADRRRAREGARGPAVRHEAHRAARTRTSPISASCRPRRARSCEFILVDSIEEVLAVAFEKPAPVRAKPSPRPERQAALPA